MLPFNLLSTVIVFALLLSNSVCAVPQYDECQRNKECGFTQLQFPFRTRGCGLKDFQIDCVDGSTPVLQINSTNYTIFYFAVLQTNSTKYKLYDIAPPGRYFWMATFKSFQNCRNSPDDSAMSLGSRNSIFNITDKIVGNVNVARCLTGCVPADGCLTGGCAPSLPWKGCSSNESLSLEILTVEWNFYEDVVERCEACEKSKGYCGYNSNSNLECLCKDGIHPFQCPPVGVWSSGRRKPDSTYWIVAVVLLACVILNTAKFLGKRASSSASQVEKFLQEFTHEMATRYSYSQLKKITNNFADKLGEGGFGVVYKGKLNGGNLVAVKILDQSRQSESQFMNEVATIGRIHHLHLVRLVGYCFEGFRSALVYEYMANGSLEKFVFEKKEKRQILSWEQLYSIALGAARGIAYLHEECERRIIHFDIKPHNILLDADFTPKVSDFGLAKLCGRLEDHISITAARGTPGYVAPELWTRNLGPITDKADVYSFGMMLLEIVGGRKNIDVQVSHSSELYFPEWAFKLLERGEVEERLRGRVEGEIRIENDTKVVRMCKVGLWCIQYKCMDRPTMSRVVQMLEGNGEEVSNPPFPFNSSASPLPPLMSSSSSI